MLHHCITHCDMNQSEMGSLIKNGMIEKHKKRVIKTKDLKKRQTSNFIRFSTIFYLIPDHN